MASKPTQRSLKELRARGLTVEVTEHWNAFTKRRHDLFNFADMLALGETITAVQTTSGSNVSARIEKITRDPIVAPKAKAWLLAGGKILVHGWALRGKRGERKSYTLREVAITLADFKEN
jgi:carbonic anhydrase